MSEFPKLTYEALTVGEEFVSDTHLVTPEDIEAYAFAVDDHHPWFSGTSPFGGPVAHPTLMANQALSPAAQQVHRARGAARQDGVQLPRAGAARACACARAGGYRQVRAPRPAVHGHRVRHRGRAGTLLVRGQFTQMLIPRGHAP